MHILVVDNLINDSMYKKFSTRCASSFSFVDNSDLFHLFFRKKTYPRNNHIAMCTHVNVYVHTGVVLCWYECVSCSYVCVHVRHQADIDSHS